MFDCKLKVNPRSKIELWGGVECTVNRVHDLWMDQVDRSGHATRLTDFDLFKDLGITTLRHPILWERSAPHGLDTADWHWPDRSLARLRQLGITPIVGLLHHGSGPSCTDLLDPDFAQKLATYAVAVAARYPWVENYTPVNEPLTTARFSGLYGHWYPHAHDDKSFVQALLNQCRGVVLAMRAIRTVNSSARLIQTEDLGRIFSTPRLAYQAEFENERRWLSFDLLCGRVDRHHPMWSYFRWTGVDMAEVEWFLDNPCPPNVFGVNHYLSGERYLDEHLDRYPGYTHGGNGRDCYADVLAARVREDGAWGPKPLLWETWQRYALPIAVTECHNGCTREEQLRWFHEVWNAASQLRSEGVDVVAVTAWSLLGAFNWHSLVTRDDGSYEPGVFDIRSRSPRPTALAPYLRNLSANRERTDHSTADHSTADHSTANHSTANHLIARHSFGEHPILDEPGWWKRPQRFVYGFSVDQSGKSTPTTIVEKLRLVNSPVRPLLITGGRGTLARAIARICHTRGIAHHLLNREQFDITSPSSVQRGLNEFKPWAVINAAGYTRIDDAELDRERCYSDNAEGPRVLASECVPRGIQLLTFSSDMVFDGRAGQLYKESDRTDPLNYYGITKVEAERGLCERMPSALVVRSGPFFGPWDECNFLVSALNALAANLELPVSDDVIISPTYIPDLVNVSLDLLIDGQKGIWHLANDGQTSFADVLANTANLMKVSIATLNRCPLEDLDLTAKRPLFSALTSERGSLMPTLDSALNRFANDCEFHPEAPRTSHEEEDDARDIAYVA